MLKSIKCTLDAMNFAAKLLAFLILFIFNNTFTYARQGCYITNSVPQPRIYVEQYPNSRNDPVQFFTGTGYYDVPCPNGATTANTHPGNITRTVPNNNCWAEWTGGPKGDGTNVNNSGNYRLNGYLVDFDIVQCPIDVYLPVFMIAVAGLGFTVIRRAALNT